MRRVFLRSTSHRLSADDVTRRWNIEIKSLIDFVCLHGLPARRVGGKSEAFNREIERDRKIVSLHINDLLFYEYDIVEFENKPMHVEAIKRAQKPENLGRVDA
jgi:hypothetical protein